jgi:NAD(P)H dehydrogenase (quinone)
VGSLMECRLQSSRSSVLRDAVAARTTPHEVHSSQPRLQGEVGALCLATSRLLFVQYGGDVVVEAPATGDRLVATVPRGPMHAREGRRTTGESHMSGFLLSRRDSTVMRPDPWRGALVIASDPDRLAETTPPEAIASNPRWQEYSSRTDLDPVVTLDDMAWADGLAIGSPTRFGGPASQLKAFLDTTGGLWMRGESLDKVCTAFTSASTGHGGLESTVLAINNHCYHWGSLIMPLGYPDGHILKTTGNPYGSSYVARGGSTPDDDSVTAARTQGARLAKVARELGIRRGKDGSS